MTYLVATIKPWNIAVFHRHAPSLPGTWHLIDDPRDLTLDAVERFRPRYLFFPHWSWRVPSEILEAAECVCFHMTDVPYGRGGSPLQNLIARGHSETNMSALRMIEELDAGPVYLKHSLGLSGRAQEIYERAAEAIFAMIAEIVREEPVPVPQEGAAVYFERRTPKMSRLPAEGTPLSLYDHVRMLDAETYPRAFLEHGAFSLAFDRAELTGECLTARVTITSSTGNVEEEE